MEILLSRITHYLCIIMNSTYIRKLQALASIRNYIQSTQLSTITLIHASHVLKMKQTWGMGVEANGDMGFEYLVSHWCCW